MSGKQPRFAAAITTPTSYAAQDYRTSVANIHRRERNGDQALTCDGCGTETDVAQVKHSPNCASYVAPVPPAKQPAEKGKLSRGRNGRAVTSRERSDDGSLTISELNRREQAAVFDQTETTTSCALAGCGWRFDGSAADALAAAATHRAAAHRAGARKS